MDKPTYDLSDVKCLLYWARHHKQRRFFRRVAGSRGYIETYHKGRPAKAKPNMADYIEFREPFGIPVIETYHDGGKSCPKPSVINVSSSTLAGPSDISLSKSVIVGEP